MARERDDIGEIKRRLDIGAVAMEVCPGAKLRRQGRELVGLSPFKSERTPSFTVTPDKGLWFCFASAQGGDVIRLVERVMGLDAGAAIAWCREKAGLPAVSGSGVSGSGSRDRAPIGAPVSMPAPVDACADAGPDVDDLRAMDRAREIWRSGVDACGTIVEDYLRHRGIDCDALARLYGPPVPPTLRLVTGLPYRRAVDRDGRTFDEVHRGPAMVGLMASADRRLTAVHRTWLAPGGTGKASLSKAKLALGVVRGASTWLSPPCPTALIGEGYETTLTVLADMAAAGERMTGISTNSLANLAGRGLGRGMPHPDRPGQWLPSALPDMDAPSSPIPDAVRTVFLLLDADGKDPRHTAALLARATARLRARGISVRWARPPAGMDFNDMKEGAAR